MEIQKNMTNKPNLKLTFYGDDITGSTDAMEALVLAGVPTVLFLEPPTQRHIQEDFPDIQAAGLAGMSRTMRPAEMEMELPSAFMSLKVLGAPLTHYKVCSTFDSTPEIGSIGRALDIGMDVFRSKFVPVMIGAPKLKRFVVFGNHFATLGDQTYRLDRHPVMSKHPITPMDESDLGRHLRKQTEKQIGLLDIHVLKQADIKIQAQLDEMIASGMEVVVFDTLNQKHLQKIGNLLDSLGQQNQIFVVGSSGVEFALTEYWQSEDLIRPPQSFKSTGEVDQVVAISGSASPWTKSQLEWAFAHGFEGLRLDCPRLIDNNLCEAEKNRVFELTKEYLQRGKSAILYSALGPDDPSISKTKEKAQRLGIHSKNIGELLGFQQGVILKEILSQTGLRRIAVAGGDTCGHVLKQLEIFVLEYEVPLGLAAPLCRAKSHNSAFNGLEVALKGGQLGDLDFFESLRRG
jgi:3-oxoisoapionate kinase